MNTINFHRNLSQRRVVHHNKTHSMYKQSPVKNQPVKPQSR